MDSTPSPQEDLEQTLRRRAEAIAREQASPLPENFGAMSPEDARRLFGWTEPQLPDGWHGVVSTEEKQGTRVIVHD